MVDRECFIVSVIQGYVGTYDINLGGESASLSLISRLSSARAGTRFNSRGIDDQGNVANFVVSIACRDFMSSRKHTDEGRTQSGNRS